MAKKNKQVFFRSPIFIAIAAFILLFVVFWGVYSKNYNSNTNQTAAISSETADWRTFEGEGFTFKYPANYDTEKRMSNLIYIYSSIPPYGSLILESQTVPFKILSPGDKIFPNNNILNREFAVIKTDNIKTINVDGIEATTYLAGCDGPDCGFLILQFTNDGKSYKLILSSPPASSYLLTNILSTFRFE